MQQQKKRKLQYNFTHAVQRYPISVTFTREGNFTQAGQIYPGCVTKPETIYLIYVSTNKNLC